MVTFDAHIANHHTKTFSHSTFHTFKLEIIEPNVTIRREGEHDANQEDLSKIAKHPEEAITDKKFG